MNGLLISGESISFVKTPPNWVLLKNTQRQRPAAQGHRVIHHGPAQAAPVIDGIHKEPANFIPKQGNKADDFAIHFGHPCFGMNQIDVSGVVRLDLQKRLAEKRMGKMAGPQPNVDDGIGIFGFEFPDHCQSILSLIEQPQRGDVRGLEYLNKTHTGRARQGGQISERLHKGRTAQPAIIRTSKLHFDGPSMSAPPQFPKGRSSEHQGAMQNRITRQGQNCRMAHSEPCRLA